MTYTEHQVFGLMLPNTCPNVPDNILNPRNTWDEKEAYDKASNNLACQFNANFEKFAQNASKETLSGAPKIIVKV